MNTRLLIDWTRCEARGLCIELVPEVLTADDWGYPLSRHGDVTLPIPAPAIRYAEEAVRECPRLALRLIED
ncbi:MAG: ferredoxin [Marmoricola sp.]|nr:ferredoxin [Marmoricola sp.]